MKLRVNFAFLKEKMMKAKLKKQIFILFLLILSINAITAPSRNQSKSISLTPFISIHSGYKFGNLNPLPNTADVPEIEVLLENKGVSVGMSLGYFVTDHVEFQGTFIYKQASIMNDIGIGLAGIPLGKIKVSDAKAYSYSGNILYHFPFGKNSLYLTAGIGAATLSPEQLKNKTKLLLNFGTGIKAKISKRLHAVLDVRDYVSFFNYAEDFNLVYIAIYSPDFRKSQHNLGIHAGLSYLF